MPNRKDDSSNEAFFSLKRRKSPDSSDASNDQRRRITIACLRCRHRKIRCDGSDPCNKCSAAGTDCEYYAVTKEENQAAREKKALAKANRIKTPKSGVLHPAKSEEKKTASKKRAAKARRTTTSVSSDSSATPEPMPLQVYERPQERPHLHIEPEYSMTIPPSESISRMQAGLEHLLEHEDTHSVSDSADNYFGYLSSSTTSLQSSIYDPAYAHENLPYNTAHQDYHIHHPAVPVDPAYYATYDYLPGDSKIPANPLSYPMDSPQPSGLCLYIPPEEPTYPATFSPYASASNPATPMLSHSYHFTNPSPPMYQGPIDWNSRPLVPFQETSGQTQQNLHHHHHPQQQQPQQQVQPLHLHQPIHHRPRSYSDVPVYSQTVSLDQVCSAGVTI